DARAIDHARNFDAAVRRQVRDERSAAGAVVVHHVAVNSEGRVLLARFDDPTGVFPRSLPAELFLTLEHRETLFVRALAPRRPVRRVEARAAFVAGAEKLLARVALAVVGEIFGQVSRAFGDERSEVNAHILANEIVVLPRDVVAVLVGVHARLAGLVLGDRF